MCMDPRMPVRDKNARYIEPLLKNGLRFLKMVYNYRKRNDDLSSQPAGMRVGSGPSSALPD